MKGIAFWTSLVALSVLPAVAMAAPVSAVPVSSHATPAPSADMGILSLVMMGATVGIVLLRKRKA